MKTKFFALVMLAMSILWGCNDSGPSMEGIKLEMKATTTLSKVSKSGRVAGSGYTFEKALVGVSEFEFETLEEDDTEDDSKGSSDDGEDDSEKVEFKGSYVVDLIAGTSNPEFVNGNLTPGFYEEIEIELARTLADNNTMFIVFKYKPAAGDSVTVEFSTKETLEFEFEDDNGFQIDEATLTNFLVLVNLDSLFAGVDLSLATVSDDGVIRINDTTNSNLAKIVKDNLDDSCEGGEDDDDDDDIDDND
ncbi:MAG: hypothetical protein ABL895_18810 [Cyclobacteriaceae bacterium]